MDETLRRARAIEGSDKINLTVPSHNEPAKGLYQSFGFEAFSYEKHAVKAEGHIFDETQMVLFLHPQNIS